jgi:hypothetical protein
MDVHTMSLFVCHCDTLGQILPWSLRLSPNVNGNGIDVNGASPGSWTRFGWQFPRNRPRLPDFEPDTSEPERFPSPVH